MNMIQVEGLGKTFSAKNGKVEALKEISFSVEKGDVFGIIGLSGAGKSTLVRCLNLLEKPTEGNVWIHGDNLLNLKGKKLREARQNIGMIFQHFNLLMQRNVLDNVCFPMEIAGINRKEARRRALELLAMVGLSEKVKAYPVQLSGGQKQRVAIARVLANNPDILLCDEATSALDPQTTKSILALLKEINQKYGITIVVITHEMSVIQEICNKVAVLEQGHLVESGAVEELFRNPKTDAARRLLFQNGPAISSMEGNRLLRVTFDQVSAFEPIIGNITLAFHTPVNILYANTRNIGGKAQGEMVLQLPENEEIAIRMIKYLKEKKLGVEEIREDVDKDHYRYVD